MSLRSTSLHCPPRRLDAGLPPGCSTDVLSVAVTEATPWRVTITAVGELDHVSSPLLLACLVPQLDRVRTRSVVLDLTGLCYLNAGGLAVLADAAGRITSTGAQLVLRCRGQRSVLRPLELTGLADHAGVCVVVEGRAAA